MLAIVQTALNTAKIVGNTASRYSPQILVGAGIVGSGATTVLGCKATVKIVNIKLEANMLLEKVNDAEAIMNERGTDAFEDLDGQVYTRDDIVTDKLAIRSQVIMGYVKSYAPVVALGVASAASILCGFNILNKRMVMLAAAYTSLERSFALYRKRVISESGPSADRRYLTGSVIEKHEENIVDPETGEVKVKKVKGEVIKEDAEPIDYTINLGRECKAPFVKDSIDYTRTYDFLDMVSTGATRDLQTFGWVSLNDIRRELYCSPIAIGQIAGWTADGDGYVDLQPREVYDEKLGKNTIILNPNVDGAIIDTIKELEEDTDE